MFLGSSENVLALIRKNAAKVYPNLDVVTFSPPYKPEFSEEDSKAMLDAINAANPDLMWIGMTAPKQEKWTFSHWKEMNIHCHVGTVGAVFDFFAGTVKRAPNWMQNSGLEWLFRLIQQPKRMWRRYLIGNVEYIYNHRAYISKLTIDKKTKELIKTDLVLKLNTHLSYPAIIRRDNHIYIYPESGQSGRLMLYARG